MTDLKDYLAGIAIGVKFRPNFSIEDRMGAIIDELLYRKGSLFNYITFPMTTTGGRLPQKTLNNPETGDKLIINSHNIILDMSFSEKIPKEKSDDLIAEFFKTVTEKIYKIVDIHEVYLIGVVHKYIINDSDISKSIYDNFKRITFDDATSISVNFSKKNILPESKAKKDFNDFENVLGLISIVHDKKEQFFLQIDYQHIFEPKLESVVDIKYLEFTEKVKYYNNTVINDWITNQNVKKA
jgi:hypothetical protein